METVRVLTIEEWHAAAKCDQLHELDDGRWILLTQDPATGLFCAGTTEYVRVEMTIERYRRLYAVQADSVEAFVRGYYRPHKAAGRYDSLIQTAREELRRYGYAMIAPQDSVTGRITVYFED